MRLIDADALPIVSQGKNHHRKYVFADITDAQTIDAIPLDWLKEKRDSVHVWQVEGAINWLLNEWQNEQEVKTV